MPDLVLAHYPNLQYFPVETAESLRNPNGGMVSKDVIRKAMLQLHLPRAHAHAPEDRLAWVTVSYVEVNSKGVSLVKSNVINTKLDMEHGGWVDIDVSEAVRTWVQGGPYSNYGMLIQAETSSGRVINVGVKHQRSNVSIDAMCAYSFHLTYVHLSQAFIISSAYNKTHSYIKALFKKFSKEC